MFPECQPRGQDVREQGSEDDDDAALVLERDKKMLEAQCKDAHARVDEAEDAEKTNRDHMIKS